MPSRILYNFWFHSLYIHISLTHTRSLVQNWFNCLSHLFFYFLIGTHSISILPLELTYKEGLHEWTWFGYPIFLFPSHDSQCRWLVNTGKIHEQERLWTGLFDYSSFLKRHCFFQCLKQVLVLNTRCALSAVSVPAYSVLDMLTLYSLWVITNLYYTL